MEGNVSLHWRHELDEVTVCWDNPGTCVAACIVCVTEQDRASSPSVSFRDTGHQKNTWNLELHLSARAQSLHLSLRLHYLSASYFILDLTDVLEIIELSRVLCLLISSICT